MTTRTREWVRPHIGAQPVPLDEYIEFHEAGFRAVGRFCCVACGYEVSCVGLLPTCRACGGGLWESPETTPFAAPFAPAPGEDDAWHEENVQSVARLVQGVRYTLGVAAAFWVFLAVAFAYWAMQR